MYVANVEWHLCSDFCHVKAPYKVLHDDCQLILWPLSETYDGDDIISHDWIQFSYMPLRMLDILIVCFCSAFCFSFFSAFSSSFSALTLLVGSFDP